MVANTKTSSRFFLEPPLLTLLGLLVVRLGLSAVPRMDWWSLNLLRFLSPRAAIGPWLVAAVLILIALRLPRATTRLFGLLTTEPLASLVWSALAVATVLLLPDETHMTGDFILRQRAVEEGLSPHMLFAQASPLDVWLHYTIPRLLFVGYGISPDAVARLWGAGAVAVLVICSGLFVRALRLRPVSAFAARGVIVFTGALALFTGYAKGLSDLVPCVVAVSAFGARTVARGEARGRLLIAVMTAAALHRMGLFMLPAAVAAYAVDIRRRGISPQYRVVLVGLLIGAALTLPLGAHTLLRVDVPTHLTALHSPSEWLDIVNAMLLIAPLLPLALVLAVTGWRRPSLELLPTVVLAVCLTVPVLFVTPQQGPLRDWDVFAPAALAITVLTAWMVADPIDRLADGSPPKRSARVAPAPAGVLVMAVVLSAAVPAVQWVLHLHDVRQGMRRMMAAVAEPPPRSDLARARLWDYLGVRNAWLDRWDLAADDFARSAALLPTPRVLDQWAKAEIRSSDWISARDVALAWTRRTPDDPNAWRTLAATVTHLNDRERSRVAALQILRLAPGDPDARGILDYLARTSSASAPPRHALGRAQ